MSTPKRIKSISKLENYYSKHQKNTLIKNKKLNYNNKIFLKMRNIYI